MRSRRLGSLSSGITALLLAGLFAACGGEARVEDAQGSSVGGQDELTAPLVSGVSRRTYGAAAQLRTYTFAIGAGTSHLSVSLAGTGDGSLVVKDPSAGVRCSVPAPGLAHDCQLANVPSGTWVIEVTGLSAFSGTLVATGSNGRVQPDAGQAPDLTDAGTPAHGHGPLSTGAAVSVHTSLGFPAPAASGDASRWLLVKPQYVVSFDSTTKTPNWVSWELSSQWLGSAARSPSFHPDADLPNTVPQAGNGDYDGTAYARGHMCPSSDRTDSAADNEATFVFTNVVPQLPNLNNGPWKGLEIEERALVKAGKTLYVTSGPIRGKALLGSGVTIPSATWKVVVVLDAPGSSASVTTSTRVIAVIMQNDPGTTAPWVTYRTTVRDIEAQAGLDLLSDVATAVQDVVETQVDTAKPIGS